MRIGELAALTRRASSPLRRSDVTLRHLPSGEVVELNVRFSKTDQYGRGCTVCVPAVSNRETVLCPVHAVKQYLRDSPEQHSHFLPHFDCTAMTRSQFAAILRRVLNFVGIRNSRYTSHSFRIGAATSAAMAGIPENEIQKMGRLQSGVYRRYVRIAPEFVSSVMIPWFDLHCR